MIINYLFNNNMRKLVNNTNSGLVNNLKSINTHNGFINYVDNTNIK